MELAKLTITPREPSKLPPIKVQFNPNTYSITKPVTWRQPITKASGASDAAATSDNYRDLDAPPLQFGGGGARTLSLQLFFDVTEAGPDADVRSKTSKIVELTRIERDQQQPPVCVVDWGTAPNNLDFPFVGVVSNLSQSFVLFRASGQPVRANLTLAFTEFIDPEPNKRQTDPDLTTYLVKRGDTLGTIAAAQYRDPALWRVIAAANDIDDPRDLSGKIGQRLAIPQLT